SGTLGWRLALPPDGAGLESGHHEQDAPARPRCTKPLENAHAYEATEFTNAELHRLPRELEGKSQTPPPDARIKTPTIVLRNEHQTRTHRGRASPENTARHQQ